MSKYRILEKRMNKESPSKFIIQQIDSALEYTDIVILDTLVAARKLKDDLELIEGRVIE